MIGNGEQYIDVHVATSYGFAYGILVQPQFFSGLFVGNPFLVQEFSQQISSINKFLTLFHMDTECKQLNPIRTYYVGLCSTNIQKNRQLRGDGSSGG